MVIEVSNGTVTEKQLNSVVTHSVNDEGEKHPVSPPVGDLMFDNFFLLSRVPEGGFHNRTVLVAKSLTDSNFEELVKTASEPPKKRRSEKEIAKAAARKSRALRRFVESAYPAEALFENFFDMMRAVGTFDKNDVWIRLYEPFDSISDLKDLDKVGRYYVLESPDFMPYEKLRTLMDSSPKGNRKTRPQDVVDLTHNQDARKGHVESYIVYHYLPKRSPEEIEAAYRAFGRLKKKLSSAKKVEKIDYELRWKTDKVLTNYCFNFAIYSPLQIVVENFVYGTSTYRETAMKVADYAEKVFQLFS